MMDEAGSDVLSGLVAGEDPGSGVLEAVQDTIGGPEQDSIGRSNPGSFTHICMEC